MLLPVLLSLFVAFVKGRRFQLIECGNIICLLFTYITFQTKLLFTIASLRSKCVNIDYAKYILKLFFFCILSISGNVNDFVDDNEQERRRYKSNLIQCQRRVVRSVLSDACLHCLIVSGFFSILSVCCSFGFTLRLSLPASHNRCGFVKNFVFACVIFRSYLTVPILFLLGFFY